MDNLKIKSNIWLKDLDKALLTQKLDPNIRNEINSYFSRLNLDDLASYGNKKAGGALKAFRDWIKNNPTVISSIEKIGTPEERNEIMNLLNRNISIEPNPISIKMNDIINNWYSKESSNISKVNNTVSSIVNEQNNSVISSFLSLADSLKKAISVQVEKKNNKKYAIKGVSIDLKQITSNKVVSDELSKTKINGFTAMHIADILNKNNLNKITVNKEIMDGLKNKNIFVKARAFNSAVNREVINPEKDIENFINAFFSALSRGYSNNQEKVESQVGSVNSTIIKPPTVSTGNLHMYNIYLNINYAPLNRAEVDLNASGQVIKYNLRQIISIGKGLSASASFNFGAAFLEVESSWYVGDYSQKIMSIDKVVPIANSNIALHYSNKNTSFTAGIRFLPGVDVDVVNDKLKISPTVQKEIFASVSIKI